MIKIIQTKELLADEKKMSAGRSKLDNHQHSLALKYTSLQTYISKSGNSTQADKAQETKNYKTDQYFQFVSIASLFIFAFKNGSGFY